VGNVVDVNASGGYVGGDKYAVGAVLETLKSLVALALRAVAVDAGHFVFPALQKFSEPIGTVFGAREDEERSFLVFQQMNQEIELGTLLDLVAEEINLVGWFRGGSNRDSHRFVNVGIDKVGDGTLDGRREQHRLAFARQFFQDSAVMVQGNEL
jgi:hypothetical protein